MAEKSQGKSRDNGELASAPMAPVLRFTRPLVRFLKIESASGVVLLICTAVALVAANSPLSEDFLHIWETPVNITIGGSDRVLPGPDGVPGTEDDVQVHQGGFHIFHPEHATLHYWINDCLMVIFFFVVGLEIKREMVDGELSEWRKASLPVMAALGGMVVPASIYLSQHYGGESVRGWGVPMATDIAFVVGVLALLGKRVPLGLKILLLSLAIADDIGAVLVIAVAYTEHLMVWWLALAAVGFLLCWVFNRAGVRAVGVYFIVGALIWLCFVKSGVHPTVAGVLLGLMTPASAWIGDKTLLEVLRESVYRVENRGDHRPDVPDPTPVTMYQLSHSAREAVSPLERLESGLHPWVSFVIMPLFALANAGVVFQASELTNPVAVAVATGLFFGKPLGVVLFSYVAVRLGIAALPAGVNWKVMIGAGCLAGIGFTMALFVNGLAFNDAGRLDAGKVGILIASLCSAILGSALLIQFLPKSAPKPTVYAD